MSIEVKTPSLNTKPYESEAIYAWKMLGIGCDKIGKLVPSLIKCRSALALGLISREEAYRSVSRHCCDLIIGNNVESKRTLMRMSIGFEALADDAAKYTQFDFKPNLD